MSGERTPTFARRPFKTVPFFDLGSERSEALLSAQKILFEGYEESMRAWLERVQTEASLWSELPVKMAGSGSITEALEAYNDCVSRQIQMSVEDGQQLLDDCRRIARKVVDSLGGERSTVTNGSDLPLCL